MVIKVNGRFQGQRVTGVQRYAREITARLADRVEIVAPRRSPGGLRGHLWEQSALGRRLNGALLWSPCNTGPLTVSNQVVTIHDCAFHDQAGCYSRGMAFWYGWLIPRLARRVRRIITVSEFSRQRLCEYLRLESQKVAVIPNAVDPRFRPVATAAVAAVRQRLKLPAHYVLSVGSLEPRKNLKRLLEAWKQLGTRRAGVQLVLAGAAAKVFRDAGLDFGPADDVLLLGYVEDEDLPALYTGAEMFVYPSLYEGFGFPPLEAMACGTPVVTSCTTSLPEVVGDAALLVDPISSEAIAAAIERMLRDTQLRADLRGRGIQRSAAFCWDRTAAATWQVLVEAE